MSPPSCLRREKRSLAQIISTLPVSCLAMHTPVSWLYLFTPTTTCAARQVGIAPSGPYGQCPAGHARARYQLGGARCSARGTLV